MAKEKEKIPKQWDWDFLIRLKKLDKEAFEYVWNDGKGRPEVDAWCQSSSALDYLFSWSETPQGHDYWAKLYYTMQGTPDEM